MAILYYDDKKLFQLNTEKTTYVIGLSPEGYVGHVYYGPASARRAGSVPAPHGRAAVHPVRQQERKIFFPRPFPDGVSDRRNR